MWEDVFPIEKTGIFQPATLVYWRVSGVPEGKIYFHKAKKISRESKVPPPQCLPPPPIDKALLRDY